MSNYKTVFFTLGVLLIVLGFSMLVPITVQLIYNEFNSTFIISSIITITFGILFFLYVKTVCFMCPCSTRTRVLVPHKHNINFAGSLVCRENSPQNHPQAMGMPKSTCLYVFRPRWTFGETYSTITNNN